MSRFVVRMLLACSLTALASCTLMYGDDFDKKQCKSNKDCPTLPEGSVAYSCLSNVCVLNEVDAAVGAARVACKNAKDCETGERCGFDGFCYEKWGCLEDDPDWLDNVKQDFTYESEVRSLQSPDDASLLGTISAMACSAADPKCERPKVPESASKVSADKVLTVPFKGVGSSGFVGVIKMVAELPKDADGEVRAVLPGYFHFTGENPLVTDVITQDRALLIDEGTYGNLSGLSSVGADPNAGTVVFLMYDCGGQSAADISITPSGVENFAFVPIQGETTPVISGTATTDDGVAILVNIPPGSQVFTLKDTKLGLVSDTFSFNVRGSAINYVQYYPRYSGLKAWLDERARKAKKP